MVLIVPLFLSFLATPGLCCFLRVTRRKHQRPCIATKGKIRGSPKVTTNQPQAFATRAEHFHYPRTTLPQSLLPGKSTLHSSPCMCHVCMRRLQVSAWEVSILMILAIDVPLDPCTAHSSCSDAHTSQHGICLPALQHCML